MRVLPFLVAPRDEVFEFTPVILRAGDAEFAEGDPVVGWDYLTPVTVSTAVQFNAEAVSRATGIEDITAIGAFLQVDCLATMRRDVVSQPLRGDAEYLTLQVELAPGSVAEELEVRTGLLLLVDDPARTSALAAFQRGSLLGEPASPERFHLEGQGSTFPVEAFSFAAVGLSPDAPWNLHFSALSLADPFKRSVRLNVNTDHPQAAAILDGEPGVVSSVVHHGVVLDLLLACAPLTKDGWDGDYTEGSVGDIADSLCREFLGSSLSAFVHDLEHDTAEVMTRLRAGTELLRGEVA